MSSTMYDWRRLMRKHNQQHRVDVSLLPSYTSAAVNTVIKSRVLRIDPRYTQPNVRNQLELNLRLIVQEFPFFVLINDRTMICNIMCEYETCFKITNTGKVDHRSALSDVESDYACEMFQQMLQQMGLRVEFGPFCTSNVVCNVDFKCALDMHVLAMVKSESCSSRFNLFPSAWYLQTSPGGSDITALIPASGKVEFTGLGNHRDVRRHFIYFHETAGQFLAMPSAPKMMGKNPVYIHNVLFRAPSARDATDEWREWFQFQKSNLPTEPRLESNWADYASVQRAKHKLRPLGGPVKKRRRTKK